MLEGRCHYFGQGLPCAADTWLGPRQNRPIAPQNWTNQVSLGCLHGKMFKNGQWILKRERQVCTKQVQYPAGWWPAEEPMLGQLSRTQGAARAKGSPCTNPVSCTTHGLTKGSGFNLQHGWGNGTGGSEASECWLVGLLLGNKLFGLKFLNSQQVFFGPWQDVWLRIKGWSMFILQCPRGGGGRAEENSPRES